MAKQIQYKLNIDDGNSAQTLGSLEGHLQGLQDELRNTEIGSQRFKELQQEIAQTDARVREFDRQMEGMDTEQLAGQFGDLAMAGGDLAAGFALITGAGEDAQETFNEVFGALEAMEGAIRAPIAAMNLYTQRMTIMNGVNKALIVSQRTLNTVMRANPWGAVATAVGLAATALATWYTTSEDATEQTNAQEQANRRLNDALKESTSEVADQVAELEGYIHNIKEAADGSDEQGEAIEQLRDQYGEHLDNYETEEQLLNDIEGARQAVIDGIWDEVRATKAKEEVSAVLEERYEREAEGLDDITHGAEQQGASLEQVLSIKESLRNEIEKGNEVTDETINNIAEENDLTVAQTEQIRGLAKMIGDDLLEAREKDNELLDALLEKYPELDKEQEENTETTKKHTKATEDNTEAIQDNVNWTEQFIKWARQRINAINQEEEEFKESMKEFENELEQMEDLEDKRTKNTEDESDKRIEQHKKEKEESAKAAEEANDRINKSFEDLVTDEVIDEWGKNITEGLDITEEQAQAMVQRTTEITVDTVNQMVDRAMQQRQERIDQQREREVEAAQDKADTETAILEAQLENETITEEEFAAKKRAIDRRRRQDEYNAKVKEFEAEKDLELQRLAINTAAAIVQTWAQLGWPAGAIVSAALAASAAVQAAQIENQEPPPPPEFQRGGIIGGRRHAQGGSLIEAEEGEIILNRNVGANPQMLQMASAMNEATGGDSFTSGGGARQEGSQRQNEAPVRAYVVEKDITDKQKKQRQRERRAKL